MLSRIGALLALALTVMVGSFGISAPAHAGSRILLASCLNESDPCWDGTTPTPWGATLDATELADTGLGTTQAFYAQQIGCCVIRLGSLQVTFQTPGGPVTETAPEFNGDGTDGLFIAAEWLIPADATSAGISGTWGNSTVPNTSLENLFFGAVISDVPEPAAWAMMLVGLGLVGSGLRLARRKSEVALGAA